MLRFNCSCGTEIFFENNHCAVCGQLLGFEPQRLMLLPLRAEEDGHGYFSASGQRYRFCELQQDQGCNWLIPAQDNNRQCVSCRTTRTIPTQTLPRNRLRWQRLEQTKRRALYMPFRLGLPLNIIGTNADEYSIQTILGQPPLLFDFLEDQRSNPDVMEEFIYSGHNNGVITVNAAEAEDSFRATNRELMNELYRTLLGHFRHELGHYYGLLLDEGALVEFRQLFGDERADYQAALSHYYEEGARADWLQGHISAYASAHPLEDWAETWAHYLHIRDTLETAVAYKLIDEPLGKNSFELALTDWGKLTVMLNALNRSMGVDDAYPFVITDVIRRKLGFIDRLVTVWQANGHNVARQ
jgi:hypothetical protein